MLCGVCNKNEANWQNSFWNKKHDIRPNDICDPCADKILAIHKLNEKYCKCEKKSTELEGNIVHHAALLNSDLCDCTPLGFHLDEGQSSKYLKNNDKITGGPDKNLSFTFKNENGEFQFHGEDENSTVPVQYQNINIQRANDYNGTQFTLFCKEGVSFDKKGENGIVKYVLIENYLEKYFVEKKNEMKYVHCENCQKTQEQIKKNDHKKIEYKQLSLFDLEGD